MEYLRDEYPYSHRQAVKSLDIIIIGAGIAGLSAGLALSRSNHSVTILESASELGEVGAGIQLAPNATRILHRLGVLAELMEYTTVLSGISVRRYDSDEELKYSPMMPSMGYEYGAPMGVIHRGDLHRILLRAALRNGCRVLTSHFVIAVDSSFAPRVQARVVETGNITWFEGDIVIAADGINSVCRKQMALAGGYANRDQPYPTGDAAYRLVIPREKVQNDPELVAMINQNVALRYMGPGGHIMAYPLRKNKMYNMVLLHPAKETTNVAEDVWKTTGDRREMMDFYSSWSPAIRKWLACAGEDNEDEILEWTLNTFPPLPKWVRGSVALIGDACHPMLPYVAQGAANGIEDAAVIAVSLTCTSDVQLVLGVYEAVRKERAEKIVASASGTGKSLHLADGPEQEKRDKSIRDARCREGASDSDTADKWRDQEWQKFMWGVDVMRETVAEWSELSATARMELTPKVPPPNTVNSVRAFFSEVPGLLQSIFGTLWKRAP